MEWTKLPSIEGGSGPCLCCGATHARLPMEAVVAVGFGSAGYSRDGETLWQEEGPDDDFPSVGEVEEKAKSDPNHDWRIWMFGPMRGVEYQREGEAHWVLVKKDDGFA
jgi:hypothetical protein